MIFIILSIHSGPGRTRTCDLVFIRHMLVPTELQAQQKFPMKTHQEFLLYYLFCGFMWNMYRIFSTTNSACPLIGIIWPLSLIMNPIVFSVSLILIFVRTRTFKNHFTPFQFYQTRKIVVVWK